MKKLTQLGLICGVLLFACLLIWQGIPEILQILFTSGWQLLCLPLVWLPSLIPATQAWRLLFINNQTPPFQVALLAIWMGRAVNNLLPVATIGGEILKARIISLKGCHVTDASASVLVDKTVQVLAVLVWGLIGVGLLLYSTLDDDLAMIALAGFAALAMAVGGFLFVQRAGMFTLLAKLGGIFSKPDSWEGIHQSAKEVDKVVLEIYSNKGQFTAALAYKSLGLVLS